MKINSLLYIYNSHVIYYYLINLVYVSTKDFKYIFIKKKLEICNFFLDIFLLSVVEVFDFLTYSLFLGSCVGAQERGFKLALIYFNATQENIILFYDLNKI